MGITKIQPQDFHILAYMKDATHSTSTNIKKRLRGMVTAVAATRTTKYIGCQKVTGKDWNKSQVIADWSGLCAHLPSALGPPQIWRMARNLACNIHRRRRTL